MKNIQIILALLFTIITFSCKQAVCDKNTACTEEFRNILLKVNNTSNKPLIVKVWDANSGKYVHTYNSMAMPPINQYVLIDDGDMMTISKINTNEIFTAEFYLSGILVQKVNYLVGKDCCHVYTQSTITAIDL
jgi:hypothetical protein